MQPMMSPRIELREGLAELLRAREYASDTDCNPWEFAVDLASLAGMGITGSDVRWLVKKGFAELAEESTERDDEDRVFQAVCNLRLEQATRLVLTELGVQLARRVLVCEPTLDSPLDRVEPELDCSEAEQPCWDPEHRVLRLGQAVVKAYRRRSPNQEAILNAFQEEAWPARVDDPLPPRGDQLPKERLHDTIKSLNQRHEQSLIRFFGDGTGEGVCWEKNIPATLAFPAASHKSDRRAA